MFFSKAFLSLLLLAISFENGSNATPSAAVKESPVTLKFARSLNLTGFGNIAEADRARAKILKVQGLAAAKSSKSKRTPSFTITNTAVAYTANVGIGRPATNYTLLIDTASSNTWVGAKKAYVTTSTSVCTSQPVGVTYGTGSFTGTECTDTVTLSPSLVITKQGIGIATSATGTQGADGILGIGPTNLTAGTLTGSSDTIPTVTDNLYTQGAISTEAVGIFYAPITSGGTGELTFGGTDTSKYTSGTLTYTSLTTTSPSNKYWGINGSITYGSTSILASTAGIVDTGTTLTLIATDAYNKYVSATGATLDSTTGLLTITSAQYNALQNLNFQIGSATYSLTPNAQIWPRALNILIGGTSGTIYLIVGDIGSNSGEGLDFINGYTFLERFYSVFDTTNKRVGFAITAYTTSTSN